MDGYNTVLDKSALLHPLKSLGLGDTIIHFEYKRYITTKLSILFTRYIVLEYQLKFYAHTHKPKIIY